MSSLGAAVLIARKDLRLELRTKDVVGSAGLFALLVLVTASFAFPAFGEGREGVAAGMLWMAFLFSALLAMSRSFALEKEDGCFDALLVSPAPRESIFLGKLLAALAFTCTVEAVILPLSIGLLHLQLPGVVLLVVTTLLGTFGIVTVGTLFAAIAVNTRGRESILPLLVMPVSVPLLIASVKATEVAIGGSGAGAAGPWILLAGGCDVLFLLVGLITFPYVTEG